MLKFLIKSGAKINAKDKDGSTPLHTAVEYNNPEAVKFLIEKGARFDMKNNNGKAPLDIANDNAESALLADYLSQLQNEDTTKETVTNKDPCIICMGPKNGFYALVPCGHASLCEDCCKKITKDKFGKCPTCRKPSKSYKKIFFQASE